MKGGLYAGKIMLTTRDDEDLIKISLAKGFVLEDEVRECKYLREKEEGLSIISILKQKGYLADSDYKYLVKRQADRELKRRVREQIRLSPSLYSERIADALAEAEDSFVAKLRRKKYKVTGDRPNTIMICPGCRSRYNASVLKAGTIYKCRKCGNTMEVPEHGKALELEPEAELLEALDMDDLVGQIIGNCRLIERVGEGGMGVVYRGKHLTLERDVAIKILAGSMTDDFFRGRFLAEARAAAKLIHPNVVQIFDAGEERDNPYIIMEYVEGATVKQLINTRKRLGLAFIIRVVTEAAQGLAAAHKLKLVHRDVKPENIMISFTGDTKVMDFGLAKHAGMKGDITRAGMLMGTPFYMAPEQFMSDLEVDHRADIYALGVTLYHMLAGRPPFMGDSPYKIMNAHLNDDYKPITRLNKDVTPELVSILDKMLLKDREKRYQNMVQIVKDMDKIKINTTKSDL